MTDSSKGCGRSTEVAINLIRLCFASGKEEKIALDLAQFLGSREGSQIADLRPDTIMDDVLDMAGDETWTTAEYSYMLELAGIDEFDDQLARMTFREFVRHAATRTS